MTNLECQQSLTKRGISAVSFFMNSFLNVHTLLSGTPHSPVCCPYIGNTLCGRFAFDAAAVYKLNYSCVEIINKRRK
jgi:hypothetical protein